MRAHRVKAGAQARIDALAAVRQARRFCRTRPCSIRVCWDLDNTLVQTGVLLRDGRSLDEAILNALPVPNMLEFYTRVSGELPGAEHFILSARGRSSRAATVAWLERYDLYTTDLALCLIPQVTAKPRLWQKLASDAELVIVDDLTFGHEQRRASRYDDLIRQARVTASSYVGVDEIASVSRDPESIGTILRDVLKSLGADENGSLSEES